MTFSETFILAAYFFVVTILAVYGWHRYYLVYVYLKNRGKEPTATTPLDPVPPVTIQLPLYNEMYVAERLIEAVCAIEYPRRAARDSGARRLDRRDVRASRSLPCAASPRRVTTSSTSTAPTASASRRARSKKG